MKRNVAAYPESGQGPPASSVNSEAMQAQIQALAYHLWIERGCPVGSPEVDWFEAEEQLGKPRMAVIAQA